MGKSAGLIIVMLLAGCAANMGVRSFSMDRESYRDLIAVDFKDEIRVPMTTASYNNSAVPRSIDQANVAVKALSEYCSRDSGELTQIRQDLDVQHAAMFSLTGFFACRNTQDVEIWMANVDARRYYDRSLRAEVYMLNVKDQNVAGYHRDVEMRRRESEARDQVLQQKTRLFEQLSGAPKRRGDMICNWDNEYGYVEDISGDRVKIQMVGEALPLEKGFFFIDGRRQFEAFRNNQVVWADASDWAKCNFSH